MKTENGETRPLRRNGFTFAFAIAAVALAVSATVMALFSLSHPSGHLQTGYLSLGLAGLAVLAWLVLAVLAIVTRRWAPALAVLPLLLAGVLIASNLDLTLNARFEVARPAFEDVIAARGEAGPDAPCPVWIGSYRISECSSSTRSSITRFYDRDGGFIDRVGFAYIPDGVPANLPQEAPVTYRPLGGPWYTFVETW